MIEKLDRPDWDTYFITLALLVAQRSIDPSTKHGAIAVDKDNTILAVGYNSPPRGCQDNLIPLTRPEKYAFMVHAEEALICNAAKHGISLNGATLYITGHPCDRCFRGILNAGIKKVVYGPIGAKCVDEKVIENIGVMMAGRNDISCIRTDVSDGCLALLGKTAEYLKTKIN